MSAGFFYLATPYSKYPRGLDAAYRFAAEQAAALIKAKIPIFCPITMSHTPSIVGSIDGRDLTIWHALNAPFIELACGMIHVSVAESWESNGMRDERRQFYHAKKPVVVMSPGVVPVDRLRSILDAVASGLPKTVPELEMRTGLETIAGFPITHPETNMDAYNMQLIAIGALRGLRPVKGIMPLAEGSFW